MEETLQTIQQIMANLTTFDEERQEYDKDFPRWMKVLTDVRNDMNIYGIENDPANIAEIYAKILTRSSRKGVCFIGGVGSGKTKRAKFLSLFGNIDMMDAAEMCAAWETMENIADYKAFLKADGKEQQYGVIPQNFCDLIIDDLGTEAEKYTSYGTVSDVMVQYVIPFRYAIFPRWRTFFTTNLTKQQLRDRYGERCWSRLNEMCAFIPVKHEDRRISK